LYTSRFTPDALADLKNLPKNVRNALKSEFKTKIHVDPYSCSEALGGPLAKFRSFHYLKFRMIYRVFEDIKTVSVVGIGKKDKNRYAGIYKQLEELAKSGKLAAAVLDTYRSIAGTDEDP
jgi:mRNA-degrading endonuclease RelE of RelBE toxin-antitoxin system